MIATLIIATSILAADFKPGEPCIVFSRDSDRKVIIATTDPYTLVRITKGIEQGDLKPLTEAEADGSLIKVPNGPITADRVDAMYGKVLEVIKLDGKFPDIVKVQLATESGKGKLAYLRNTDLMSPLEVAVYSTELEKAQKEAREFAAKLAAIDPAEVTKAIKAAKIAANRADLSVRKRAYVRERAKKLAPLAKKYGVSGDALDAWIKAQGIEK